MKFLFALLLLISTNLFATNYFVANAGSDGAAGTIGAPWQTVPKVNGFAFNSGDTVFFNRGDKFAGPIVLNRSGIVIDAYGTGAIPEITGLTEVSSWSSIGGGLYETTIGSASTLNMVLLDDVVQPIGRWPKSGYLTSQSHSGTTQIGSSAIGSALSYVGGELVIRPVHWIIQRGTVSAQTSTTVNYAPFSTPIGSVYQQTDGFGFFFQNHINACTALGDWAYNGTTHKLTMFFGGGGPGSHVVRVTTVDKLVSGSSKSNIKIRNINLTGANTRNVELTSCSAITIDGSIINYSGQDGVWINATTGLSILNSTINNSMNNGITGNSAGTPTITNCTIKNSGRIAGMGVSGDGQYQATAYLGNSLNIQNCIIDSSGYIGIDFRGTSSLIKRNYVTNFCLVKDDGAGIYTWSPSQSGSRVTENIVMYGKGNPSGTTDTKGAASGIYMDDNATGVEIDHNTSAYNAFSGILFHNCNNINVHDNTFFNNGVAQYTGGQAYYSSSSTTGPISAISLNNNIFFSKNGLLDVTNVDPAGSTFPFFTTADNNYYCRPLNESGDFSLNRGGTFTHPDLAGWRTATSKEGASQKTPVAVTDTNKIRLVINPTNGSVVTNFAGVSYRNLPGTVYTGSITLGAFQSAVLIQTISTNVPPTANAGVDRSITLPTASVTISGASGNDPDGSIASYSWSKFSGPTSFSISGGNTATPTFNGLAQGTYQFQLVVTDNSGATGVDVMRVVVSPAASNTPPTANAGTDKAITLPTSTVSLTGTGTDAEGGITYLWSYVSGPAGYTIQAPNSATTSIIGLVEGTYQFQLKVTDAGALFATDNVTVTVSAGAPPANKPPTVNAGIDQSITLPIDQVTLTSVGNDVDDGIVSFHWDKISGGAAVITTPDNYTTTVTGLSEGTYQFRVIVTDVSGATGSDLVTIVVKPAVVIPPSGNPPVSKAGNDIRIFLPKTTVQMNGTAADFEGKVTSNWVQTKGPAGANIEHPELVYTTISNLSKGTYTFRLYVTDGQGNTVFDDVNVTVKTCTLFDRWFYGCK